MEPQTGYEIDFLPVGNGERSGDAIAVRYGTPGNYKVMVYDGGTQESGEALVEHIKTHYGTTFVDYVVNSHPDADHASGLSVVLEQLQVGELWMHRPWAYSKAICDYFADGRLTPASLANRLKTKMAAAHALEQLAIKKGIPVKEPFQGENIGWFRVLSPEKDWYVHSLIPEFEKSPEVKEARSGILEAALKGLQSAGVAVAEAVNVETLRENVSTSAENESSVILYGLIDDRGILLTGDAGIRALGCAADYTEGLGHSMPEQLRFVQVPHHGSRHNVSPSSLDRILGPRSGLNEGTKTAFVSAGEGSKTHPRKSVVNAFMRRGAKVYTTQSSAKWHHHQMPHRGWGPAEPMPYSPQEEPWE